MMAQVYTRHLQIRLRCRLRAAAVAGVLLGALLAVGPLGATPAEAHTVGPQLLTIFDAIAPPAPGVSYQVLSTGAAPYVTVALSGNHTFEIFGLLGEPFIRMGPDGVQTNRRSPSVEYLIKDPAKPLNLPAVNNQPPAWDSVSTDAVFHYYERRAEWPHTGQPVEAQALGRPAVVYRFSIPASYDGRPVAILGHVRWVPAPINFEIPLLFVPFAVVILLWAEPKARPYLGVMSRISALFTALGAVLGGASSIVALRSSVASPGLAPAAVLPGLALVALLAVPRMLAGERRAYGWALASGVYLIVFGLIRVDPLATSAPGLVNLLRRAELIDGILVACSAGLLVFVTSPMRKLTARPAA